MPDRITRVIIIIGFILIVCFGCNVKNQLIRSGRTMNPHKIKISSKKTNVNAKIKKQVGKCKCKEFGYSHLDTLRLYQIKCRNQSGLGCKKYNLIYIAYCR
jgi:hypothetical protein